MARLHGGTYKAPQKQFNLYYSTSSRQGRTTMVVIDFMQITENLEHFEEFIEILVSSLTMNGCADEACKCDLSVYLAMEQKGCF